ncbi:hypothetical protein [Brevibacillus daliensis]|uniref:hypothetical protein n=1 Tax=Brevibacillus daliensis TaxID=2892995 RepID=UPI001E3BAABE|nr:hypothetical protein [Brevibacillus daliensis]
MKKILPIFILVSLLAFNGVLYYKFYKEIKGSEPRAYVQPVNASTATMDQTNPTSQLEENQVTPSQGEPKEVSAADSKTVASSPPTKTAKQTTIKETTINIYDETYKYIGETVNGVANGQGTAYYKNGNKRYEGEFLNGKPNFVGKSYFENGSVRSAGTRTNDVIQLTGYNEDGSRYSEITNKENNKVGIGKIYYPNGQILFSGQVSSESGLPNGQGTEFHQNGNMKYIGAFNKGRYHGSGKFITDDQRLSYEGQFISGDLGGGKAKFYEDGTIYYDGEHQQGVYHGKGKFYMNGSIAYEGDFANGILSGTGKMYDNGKLVYDGEFIDNMPTGNGTNYLGNSNIQISFTIRNPAVIQHNGGSFNVPDGIRIPSYGEVQESLSQ